MIQYDCEIQDMGPEEIKEANRLMWLVKGQLCPIEYSKKDIHGVYFEGILKGFGVTMKEVNMPKMDLKRLGTKGNGTWQKKNKKK